MKKILINFPKCSGGGKGNSVQEELDDDGVKQRRKHFAALTIVELYSSSPIATERSLLCLNLCSSQRGNPHFVIHLTIVIRLKSLRNKKDLNDVTAAAPFSVFFFFCCWQLENRAAVTSLFRVDFKKCGGPTNY